MPSGGDGGDGGVLLPFGGSAGGSVVGGSVVGGSVVGGSVVGGSVVSPFASPLVWAKTKLASLLLGKKIESFFK